MPLTYRERAQLPVWSQTSYPMMNQYLPISSYELASFSSEKSILILRNNSLGKEEIFWLSLLLRVSIEKKCHLRCSMKDSLQESVTLPSIVHLLFIRRYELQLITVFLSLISYSENQSKWVRLLPTLEDFFLLQFIRLNIFSSKIS